MKSTTVLFALILLFVGACSDTSNPIDNETYDIETEDIQVSVLERSETYVEEEVGTHVEYPFFSFVILEKGYTVLQREAAHFRAKDKLSGKIIEMTAIPCRIPGSDESVAMIYYMKGEDGYSVSAVEYFKHEDYEVSHVLDQEAYSLMSEYEALGLVKIDAKDDEEVSTRFWKCVVKRITAGCLGCALTCFLSGPAWGPCATACCSGGVVVAIVSCAFTVYGW